MRAPAVRDREDVDEARSRLDLDQAEMVEHLQRHRDGPAVRCARCNREVDVAHARAAAVTDGPPRSPRTPAARSGAAPERPLSSPDLSSPPPSGNRPGSEPNDQANSIPATATTTVAMNASASLLDMRHMMRLYVDAPPPDLQHRRSSTPRQHHRARDGDHHREQISTSRLDMVPIGITRFKATSKLVSPAHPCGSPSPSSISVRTSARPRSTLRRNLEGTGPPPHLLFGSLEAQPSGGTARRHPSAYLRFFVFSFVCPIRFSKGTRNAAHRSG